MKDRQRRSFIFFVKYQQGLNLLCPCFAKQNGLKIVANRQGFLVGSCHLDLVGASYVSLAPIFYEKIRAHSRRCSSSFAKSHARFACSVVKALPTAHSRYRLFASLRLRRRKHCRKLIFIFTIFSFVV